MYIGNVGEGGTGQYYLGGGGEGICRREEAREENVKEKGKMKKMIKNFR